MQKTVYGKEWHRKVTSRTSVRQTIEGKYSFSD